MKGLAGARITGEGHPTTLVLEHRDGSTLTCAATGADARALRAAARERLGVLLEGGPESRPRCEENRLPGSRNGVPGAATGTMGP